MGKIEVVAHFDRKKSVFEKPRIENSDDYTYKINDRINHEILHSVHSKYL